LDRAGHVAAAASWLGDTAELTVSARRLAGGSAGPAGWSESGLADRPVGAQALGEDLAAVAGLLTAWTATSNSRAAIARTIFGVGEAGGQPQNALLAEACGRVASTRPPLALRRL